MDPNLLAFIRGMEEVGPLQRNKSRHHFVHESGSFICFKINRRSHEVRIENIFATPPKNGMGSALMAVTCNLADSRGIVLTLNAMPFGPLTTDGLSRISRAKLIDWYRTFGFVTNIDYYAQLNTMDLSEGLEMIRLPNGIAV